MVGHSSENFIPDKSKSNYLQRCYYVISLFKDKDYDLWENFHAQYSCTPPEESWELFQLVVDEYRKLLAPVKKAKVHSIAKKKKKAPARKSAARKAA